MKHLPLAVAILALAAAVVWSGPLNPPAGPIQSSYKTLDEVEARIPINQTNTPGDASNLFVITRQGSYILTGDIDGVAGRNGIRILVPNVTIDLNGFTLRGVPQSLDGITSLGVGNVVVRNGTVRQWGLNGITANGTAWRIEDVLAGSNGNIGIQCNATDSRIERCVVQFNGGIGIRTGDRVRVEHAFADSNASVGISVNNSSRIENSTATRNGTVLRSAGFQFGDYCVLRDNHADQNDGNGYFGGIYALIENCVSQRSTRNGFDVDDYARFIGCSADQNGEHGFEIEDESVVRNCVANTNGLSAPDTFAGFFSNREQTRFEGNYALENAWGYRVLGIDNILINNTATGNTTNYNIGAGSRANVIVAQILQDDINGSLGGARISASNDPHANFSH